jgi:hypothetical protein
MRHYENLLWVGEFLALHLSHRTREPLPEPSGHPGLKEFATQFPAQPTISMTKSSSHEGVLELER